MDKADNTPLQFGTDFNRKYTTVIDVSYENDAMPKFLQDCNINFNFLPVIKIGTMGDLDEALKDEIPNFSIQGALLDYIMQTYGRDKDKKILLIVTLGTFKKLLYEKSVFNLKKLIQLGKIQPLLYSDYEMIPMLYKQDQETLNKFGQFKMFVLCGGQPGTKLKSLLQNFTFVNHLFFDQMDHIKFGTFANESKKKTKTFLCYMFLKDARPSRKFLFEQLQKNVNLKQCILKTHETQGPDTFNDLYESYGTHTIPNIDHPNALYKRVVNHQLPAHLPAIQDYNQTCYEIVNEGLNLEQVQDDAFFLTEKFIKPITMKHPFLMVNTKHSVKKLQDFGFKTFNNFIDESYDNCEHYKERVHAILKTVKKLDLVESQKFYNNTREICQHNLDNLLKLQGFRNFNKFKNWKKVFEQLLYE